MLKPPHRKFDRININRTRELALRLGVPLAVLEQTAANMQANYYPFEKSIDGKPPRKLYDTSASLREIHKKIEQEVLNRFNFPFEFKGGIKDRSLLDNALAHSGKKNIANLDLKKFFPSVKPQQVFRALCELGCTPPVSQLITTLVTADNHIPQGFKTSPKIGALVLLKMNSRLKKFLGPFGTKLTFWIDDLTLSAKYPLKKIKPMVKKIVKQSGFIAHKDEGTPVRPNPTYRNHRQMVTGIVINTKPSIPREKRWEIEKRVHLCEKFGIRNYRRKYLRSRIPLVKIVQETRGKISNMISIDELKYRPLGERWEILLKKEGLITI